jgi:hypothetical protein
LGFVQDSAGPIIQPDRKRPPPTVTSPDRPKADAGRADRDTARMPERPMKAAGVLRWRNLPEELVAGRQRFLLVRADGFAACGPVRGARALRRR